MGSRFGIRAGDRVAIVAAPRDSSLAPAELPDDVTVRDSARGRNDVIVFYAARRNELARRIGGFARSLDDDGQLWIAWPRRNSGVITDLTEREIRDIGAHAGLVDNKVSAINDAWSGVRFVHPSSNGKGGHRAR
ncbi:MAG: DUF3052 family protein [Acidimicrobiia bacterium]